MPRAQGYLWSHMCKLSKGTGVSTVLLSCQELMTSGLELRHKIHSLKRPGIQANTGPCLVPQQTFLRPNLGLFTLPGANDSTSAHDKSRGPVITRPGAAILPHCHPTGAKVQALP